MVKARSLGFRVRERPVRHYPRAAGSPTGARPAVIARAFKELFRLRLNLRHELAERQVRAANLDGPAAHHTQPPTPNPQPPRGGV